MHNPILKLTALAGVVGIGFLVVYQAQKGMLRPADNVDAQQAFVDLAGNNADQATDPSTAYEEGQPADDTNAASSSNPDEKFPFGTEPSAPQPSSSGISFLEQAEPKIPEGPSTGAGTSEAGTAPKAGDVHHDHEHDGADPHAEIAAGSKDPASAHSFDPFAADAHPQANSAQAGDRAHAETSVPDSDKGVQQAGFDAPASGAPPTLATASEPAPSSNGVSSASSPGGPQLFAPNPEPTSQSASGADHGRPEAFPFDAQNAPRPISKVTAPERSSTASNDSDSHAAEIGDAGPLAPSKDSLNDEHADHATRVSKDRNPVVPAAVAANDDAPARKDEPKTKEDTAGESVPVELGAPREKTDAAQKLDRQAPNPDVPDPTLSDPFGSIGKQESGRGKDKKDKDGGTDSAQSGPSIGDADPTTAEPGDRPAPNALNERPKADETPTIPQRQRDPQVDHDPQEEIDATSGPDGSEPPLIRGENGDGEDLPRITPRFPKRGGEEPKRLPKASHEPAPARRQADILKGDGTIREDAPQGPQQPRLKLEKSAPANAIIGQPMIYNIFVENVGNSPAHKVVVQDRIPRGSKLSGTIPRAELINRQLTWKLGTLDPGEKQRISVRVTPTDAGTLGSVATVSFEAQVAARTVITSPKVSIDMNGPERAKVGEPVTFHFKVTNEGSGAAQKVVLRNILPTGLNHAAGKELEYDVGTLPAGATRDVELTLTAAESGEMVNRAVVTTADGFSAETKASVNVEELGLLISREGPARRVVGRVGAFINTVTNRSSQPMFGVQIVETVPQGMEFVEASDGGQYEATKRTVTWQIEKLDPREDRKVQVKLMARAAGELSSGITAVDRNGNKVETTSQTVVSGFAAVTLELPALPGPVDVGETVTLRIEAGNKGTSAATNVKLQVSISDEMELVSIKGATEHQRNGNSMRFAPIPSLGERTPAVFEIALKARRSGDARVAVQIEADQLSKPVHREEAILILPSGQ